MARKKDKSEGSREPNGASSIYYGADGYWHGRVTVGVKDNGKDDRRHVQRKDYNEVLKAVRKLERERDQGRVRKPGASWTVERWLNHWLENIVALTVRYKTQTYYQTGVSKYLIPEIDAHRLERLEPEHIEKMYQRLRRKKTVDDAQAILRTAAGRRNSARWAVALALGYRQGEALGLQWPDLEFDIRHGCDPKSPCGEEDAADCPKVKASGRITVRRAIQRQTWQHGCTTEEPCNRKRAAECYARHGGGLVTVAPKSRAGRRKASCPPPLVLALYRHKLAQDAERKQAGELWKDGQWMFAQPTGRPVDPRADYREWKALLADASVREARLHDARHTAATFLLVLGVDSRAAMDLMGWSKIDMAQRYMHVRDGLRTDIANQLGDLLWKRPDDDDGDGSGAPVPAGKRGN